MKFDSRDKLTADDTLDRMTASIPCTYTVYLDDGTYYAESNLKGTGSTADYDDTDFADLLNNDVIPAMFDSEDGPGGLIRLTSPCYTLDAQIEMKAGIWVQGQGITGMTKSGLTGAWTLGTTIECASNDITVFNFDYDAGLDAHFFSGISDLHIVGCEYDSAASSTKPLIDFQCNDRWVSDVYLERLYIHHGMYGIRMYNNEGTGTYKMWNLFVHGCMPESNTDAGILLESPVNEEIERVRITNCHFYGNNSSTGNGAIEIDGHKCIGGRIMGNTFEKETKSAIYAADEAEGFILNGNVIYDCDTGSTDQGAIDLSDVDFFTVCGNNIRNVTSDYMKYGIYTDDNCTYCCIVGNVCRVKTGGDGIVTGAGAGMIGDATMNVELASNL